jgi:thiol-disulfide isomerase/thioredoxin
MKKIVIAILFLVFAGMLNGGGVFYLSGAEYNESESVIETNSPTRIVFISATNCPACPRAEKFVMEAMTNGIGSRFDLYMVKIDPSKMWVSEFFKTNLVAGSKRLSNIPAVVIYQNGKRKTLGINELKRDTFNASISIQN